MILITGATGNFGTAMIDFLLEKGARLGSIAAMVKDRKSAVDLLSKGIIVRIADFDDYPTLIDAFIGVDKLLLGPETDPANCVKHFLHVINAAKEAGVKHIFYASYDHKNETENSHDALLSSKHAVKVIKESGVPYSIFRNTFSLHSNMAEATASLLISEGYENKEYFLPDALNV